MPYLGLSSQIQHKKLEIIVWLWGLTLGGWVVFFDARKQWLRRRKAEITIPARYKSPLDLAAAVGAP
jgi:hypothetical protein